MPCFAFSARALTVCSAGLTLLGSHWAPLAWAQSTPVTSAAWQQCAATTDNTARLACFDAWSQQQQPLTAPPASRWQAPAASASSIETAAAAPIAEADVSGLGLAPTNGGCRDPRYSEISRFFELEPGSDCGTFTFRGYKPLSVSVITGSSVNTQPTSEVRGQAAFQDYQKHELRLQLSARTKIASGLLTDVSAGGKDSLWVGYSQQSYWQVFNSELSRPFRTTDHEPEIFYIYPSDAQLPLGWRWRYTGAGLVHHSNGQSNPLSRSWNRWYLMTGAELASGWQLHAKAWRRISENAQEDDNPRMQNFWGRGEIKLVWQPDNYNSLGLSARGSLGRGYGSGRLEWLRTLGEGWNGSQSNLRLHVQLFSGYGESLIDYNRKRTSLAVGLSLLDF